MPEYFYLTYGECRQRFRLLARRAGARLTAHPIAARGPDGEALTVDVAHLGAERPDHVLVVQSGTHGVEGFAGSAIQQQFLAETFPHLTLPGDTAILFVHAVNPYGFAWWRRQNEHNVDVNRNFLAHGDGYPTRPHYVALHPLLCPAELSKATDEAFLDEALRLVDTHGFAWVQRIITEGQYECADGLYYGGTEPEEANTILREIYRTHVRGAAEVLLVDLHTGHGDFGTYTLLSQHEADTPEHAYLTRHFNADRIEVLTAEGDSLAQRKAGLLSYGIREEIPDATYRAVTFELGTHPGQRIIMAERHEHWVHLRGDRTDPVVWDILWEHRECSCPDSDEWRTAALAHGRTVLANATAALGSG